MKKSARISLVAAFLFLPLVQDLSARTAVYKAAGDKRNVVLFESQATLETITGRTSEIIAQIEADPAKLSASKAHIEVDLASLDSGVGMRDQHMKSPMYLDVEKFPKAVFELQELKEVPTEPAQDGKPVTFTALGTFSLHGQTKKVAARVTALFMKESEATRQRLPGDLLHVTATFSIRLDDFGIKRPEMVVLKVAESVDIRLDFFASSAP